MSPPSQAPENRTPRTCQAQLCSSRARGRYRSHWVLLRGCSPGVKCVGGEECWLSVVLLCEHCGRYWGLPQFLPRCGSGPIAWGPCPASSWLHWCRSARLCWSESQIYTAKSIVCIFSTRLCIGLTLMWWELEMLLSRWAISIVYIRYWLESFTVSFQIFPKFNSLRQLFPRICILRCEKQIVIRNFALESVLHYKLLLPI